MCWHVTFGNFKKVKRKKQWLTKKKDHSLAKVSADPVKNLFIFFNLLNFFMTNNVDN